MQLLELSAEEIAFLTTPPQVHDSLQPRLSRKLAATLSARLRLPVQAVLQPAIALAESLATPVWQADATLSTLWLTRRLGGQRMAGKASFVPPTLIHTLNAILAECWLDAAAPPSLPSSVAWQIKTDMAQATLGLKLPQHTTDMTRWAREVIRNA